jgi:plastocyanin domain-containing protein
MNLAAISLGAMLSLAQMGGVDPLQMQPSASDRSHGVSNGESFRQIEQPLPVKVGVVLGGLTLVGAELWWFLGRKQQQQRASQSNGVQEVLITVDGGYHPDRVVVAVDTPVRLSFHRLDRNSCLDELLIPDFGISTRLPVDLAASALPNRITTVEFTPNRVGEYPFTCGMRMFRGVIEVRSDIG